ncbi:MAG TPA: alpha/beta fold hydrolase [Casimicrobiaceae bacterium]|nr:alpha/beta fold hydrolase [Casimicrobiaceae bacterium]
MDAREQKIRICTSGDGMHLAYAALGAGPPVLKVGSWLTHLEYDCQSPVWIPWLTELSRHNTLYRYDPRGCGLSDRSVAHYVLDAWVRDLETVVEAAGLARFALLGMSQGAAIAIDYAVRHPQRVERLVLYGGYARGVLRRGLGDRQREEFEATTKLIELGWGRENPAFRQLFTSMFVPGGTADEVDSFNRLQQVSATAEEAARMVRGYADIDVQAQAAKVRCPTLVLHAHGDARVPFDEGRLVASLIPGARFVPLDSRNHVVLAHEPAWKTLVTELHAFLHGVRDRDTAQPFPMLTQRERELLELIAQGRDNDDIALRLGLSNKTVRNHITRIFSKMEVTTRAQAIVRAREAGFGTGA